MDGFMEAFGFITGVIFYIFAWKVWKKLGEVAEQTKKECIVDPGYDEDIENEPEEK